MYRACPSERGRTHAVAFANLDRVGLIGLGSVKRDVDQLADVARRDRLARAEDRPQTLEDPPRLLDPIGVAFDPDLAMPGEDLDSDRVANLPEILVTTTEDSQLLGVTLQTDCDFRHASPFADPGGGDAPRHCRGHLSNPHTRMRAASFTPIMEPNRGKMQHRAGRGQRVTIAEIITVSRSHYGDQSLESNLRHEEYVRRIRHGPNQSQSP